MSVASGARLGAYEVTALLGTGGMGEVYKARDTKLNRDVALKVLPEAFASDPDRLARFKREAQVLASLNHPNIAAIYGLEEADGVRALVLELVEGPTLADRIAQGPIPLDEALPIARQVADALEAAHEHGIIHRDLKPSNIKVRADGAVKVLDFGLSKALELAPAADLSQSPTITSPAMTGMGVILGTAAYMSPEQAKGKPVDKRTDIWAFGCVLYEMLTRRRAFHGEEIADMLARIIEREADFNALPPGTPPAIRRLLRRSLEKDRKRRLPDIAVARIEIDEALTTPPGETVAALIAPRQATWRRFAGFAMAVLAASAATGAAFWFATRSSPSDVTRLTIAPPPSAALTVSGSDRDVAISPNGTRVVYVGGSGTLFVRALDQLEPTPLVGLGTPGGPFFSPDSQWIGFFNSNSTLAKVAITGGPPVTICRLDGSRSSGATWADDGTIVFATSGSSGLQKVSVDGGEATALTTPNRERGEGDHVLPRFLPGGHAVLFTIMPSAGAVDSAQVAVLDLRTGTHKVIVRGGSDAHYVSTGHLVYAVVGALRAVPFDLDRLEVTTTPPIPVLSEVVTTTAGAANFDVSRNGTLTYLAGGIQTVARTLVWVDRQGHEEPIKAPPRAYLYPRLSPEGTRVALDVRDQDNDIWMWDLARETLTRITVDPALERFPVWMPDGRRLIFSSDRAGPSNLFSQVADGTGTAERLVQSSVSQFPMSVSPDGGRIVLREDGATAGWPDLMMLTLDKERRVQPLIRTPFFEGNGVISPKGQWLAYNSNESGQFEIYVRPFPDVNTAHWQVSTAGGLQPLWARNGQELFYFATTGELMSVRVGPGTVWTAGAPTKLIASGHFRGTNTGAAATYDVSPDGRRFLMIKQSGGSEQTAAPPSLIVVQNWFEELKRLVPAK